MRHKMTLKDDDLSIIVNETRAVTGPAETGNTISPNKFFYNPLKSINTLLGQCRLSGLYPRRNKGGR